MSVRVNYAMGTYSFAQHAVAEKKAVKHAVARRRYNKTYRKKDTKRILERKIRNIKLSIITFIVIGIFSYISAEYNKTIVIEVEQIPVVMQAKAAPAQTEAMNQPTTGIDPEAQIRAIAKDMGFRWTNYLVRLAACESSLKFDAKNTRGNMPAGSIDRGIFQINSFWHKEVPDSCTFDLECSTRWTINRINSGYQQEWMCDAIIRGQ